MKDDVILRGVDVICAQKTINEVLGCKKVNHHYFLSQEKDSQKDVWASFSSLLSDVMPKWLNPSLPLYKVDINLEARCWLRFICRNICPYQNQYTLVSPQEFFVG